VTLVVLGRYTEEDRVRAAHNFKSELLTQNELHGCVERDRR
jgi:hypothetical protein